MTSIEAETRRIEIMLEMGMNAWNEQMQDKVAVTERIPVYPVHKTFWMLAGKERYIMHFLQGYGNSFLQMMKSLDSDKTWLLPDNMKWEEIRSRQCTSIRISVISRAVLNDSIMQRINGWKQQLINYEVAGDLQNVERLQENIRVAQESIKELAAHSW